LPGFRASAVHNAGGYRSSIAASILHRHGITDLIEMTGWLAAGGFPRLNAYLLPFATASTCRIARSVLPPKSFQDFVRELGVREEECDVITGAEEVPGYRKKVSLGDLRDVHRHPQAIHFAHYLFAEIGDPVMFRSRWSAFARISTPATVASSPQA
jgi:hypothetical protein